VIRLGLRHPRKKGKNGFKLISGDPTPPGLFDLWVVPKWRKRIREEPGGRRPGSSSSGLFILEHPKRKTPPGFFRSDCKGVCVCLFINSTQPPSPECIY